jgi:hypothetical protein
MRGANRPGVRAKGVGGEMARRRGNSDWSSGRTHKIVPLAPTEFEMHAKSLGPTQQNYAASAQLRSWCERNRNRCYVPEWLLKEWGLDVDPNEA